MRASRHLLRRVSPIQLPAIVQTTGVPVHVFADLSEVEGQALDQLRSLAESPIPFGFVSAMPDVHMGKGVAVGAVFASEDYVCPNAVGVDIGCGMCAVPYPELKRADLSHKDKVALQEGLKEMIPTGFASHKRALPGAKKKLEEICDEHGPTQYLEPRIFREERVANQLGTLGGGNHFLEVLYDREDEHVWLMLHSGSRHIGNSTAEHYDKLAGERGHALRGLHGSLNYFSIDSQHGQDYLKDMTWCQKYAAANRRAMLDLMVSVMERVKPQAVPALGRAINAHHNFCSCEQCNVTLADGTVINKNLWVTRKGATSAKEGEYGIIPGSMGTGSFIVKGRGNPDAWSSCSHGAGRRMSRTKAFKEVSQNDFESVMQGIVCDTHAHVRDEAPQAYKDLSQVMRMQDSLVDVEHRLLPLVNVKGFEKQAPRQMKARKGR